MKAQTKARTSTGSKILAIALLISFIITILVPITGVHIHKLASTLFLILCIVHTIIHQKTFGKKGVLLLSVILVSFLTGLFGMILDQYSIILQLHKVISITCVAFLAIHIFVYHRRLR